MIDHYEADVQTAQDYYPFGMIMPGRMLATLSIPGGSFSGTSQVNGYTLPVDLTLNGRSGNQPTSYVATDLIDLDDGFESGNNDDVTAYIADGAYAGGGNGSNDNAVAGGGKYRYGFNGKENDNEVKGVGDQIDYGMRVYDPRAGRFMSIDPLMKKYPDLSTYQYASDNPILNVDIDGLEGGRFWERFWKDPADAVYRLSWDDANEVAGTINNITPPGAIINGSYQAITSRDPVTGEQAPRIDGLGQAVIGGLFHLTVTRFVSPGLKAANLERQMAENAVASTNKSAIAATGSRDAVESNTASRSLPKTRAKVDASAGSETLDDAIRMTDQPFIKPQGKVARATDFIRTETIGGNKAARTVGENIKLIKAGKELAPVEVAEINNKLYVINGHHRLEAALRTNTELRYKVLSKAQLEERGYNSESEIIHAAAETTKVKLDNKIVKKAAGQE